MQDTATQITGRDWYTAGVAGMASYLDSSAVVSTGVALVMFQTALDLDSMKIGYLSSALAACVAVGALVGGRVGDLCGRRRVFTVTMIGLVLGSVLMAFANGFNTLLIGTIVLGLASGADLPASLALIGEAAPKGARGKLVTFSQVLWNVGILATQVVVALVADLGPLGARFLFAHLIVVSLIVLCLRMWVPESQQWTACRAQARAQPNVGLAEVRSLLRAPYRGLFIGLGLFYGLAQIVASIKAQFLSYMFVNVAHSSVRFYSFAYMTVVIIGIITMLLFMRVVDGPFRRAWFVAGALGFTCSFAVPAVFGVSVPTLFISSMLSGFGAALAFEGMMKVWVQEFFPVLLLATAQGTIIAFARILAAIVAIWAPSLLMLNASGFFAFLTGVVAVAMLIGLRLSFLSGRTMAEQMNTLVAPVRL